MCFVCGILQDATNYQCKHVKSNSAGISMSANDHQETDSRICLYVDDALNEGELLFSSER